MMLCALSAWHAGIGQIVVVGDPQSAHTRDLERELAAHYLPFAIHVPVVPGPAQDALASHLDFIRGMTAGTGAAAYVCQNFTCQQPAADREALRASLNP